MGRQSQPRVAGEGEDLGPPKEWEPWRVLDFHSFLWGLMGEG